MLWWTLRQLNSKDDRTRARAVLKLGATRQSAAVGRLIEMLSDIGYIGEIDADVGEVAARALVSIGDQSVEPLIAVLARGSGRQAARAASALGAIRDARAVAPLIEALHRTSDSEMASSCLKALGQIGDSRALEPLTNLVITKKSFSGLDGRTMAVMALGSGEFTGPAVTKLLLDVMRLNYPDTTGSLYSSAVEGLGRIGDPSCLAPLLEVITREGNYNIWEVGTDVVASFGAAALQPLLSTLESKDSTHRYVATKGLRKLRRPEAFEVLARLLTDDDGDIAAEAARGLGELKNPQAFDLLLAALKSSDFKVREASAFALGMLGDARAVKPLAGVLEDLQEDRDVRNAAAAALQMLGGGLIVRTE